MQKGPQKLQASYMPNVTHMLRQRNNPNTVRRCLPEVVDCCQRVKFSATCI